MDMIVKIRHTKLYDIELIRAKTVTFEIVAICLMPTYNRTNRKRFNGSKFDTFATGEYLGRAHYCDIINTNGL